MSREESACVIYCIPLIGPVADEWEPVPEARFPPIQEGSPERPGAVKGAPPGAAKRTLYGEDRSERIAKEGNEAFDF